MAMDKTFDPAATEPAIAARWEAAGAFRAGANARPGAPAFSMMIPPPNVTGALHVGHAFNNTLQDILARWHRMKGDDVLWQPGTDHAGIATQLVVERELARTSRRRTDMSREEFVALVWEQKRRSRGNIKAQLDRLGASCDWSREAFTMSGAPGAPPGEEGNFHDAVIRVFVELYRKGLIFRGKRLVNWDPHFETAISDLEVENVEVAGHMWHFRYPLAGGETYTYVERDAEGRVTFEEERDWIAIATTRPETMLGDGAVAVHPGDARYAPLVGKLCEIPVGPKENRRLIPIIADPYPDPAFGSGAVKITGAHDFNDWAVAQRAGIPCYRLMDTRAAMRSDGPPYAEAAAIAAAVARGERRLSPEEADALNLVPDHLRGLDRFEARARIVAEITAEGLAVMTRADDPRLGPAAVAPGAEGAEARVPLVEAKTIMQPFGDRSKVVIEPMLTDQWFVDTARIVGPALEAVRTGRTRIMPESGEKTYYHWLENIEPWCISRQLWWGHRIPVWYDEAGNHYCAMTEAEAQAMAGGRRLTRDPDVLDTWFSSGLWPIGTLGWPEDTAELRRYFPTSVLVTGQDILFFWVARMMMMQLAVVGEVPFRDVYLHQLIRDEKGEKMSKTKGNVIDPLDVIAEYGADALRFTFAAMAAPGATLKLSMDRIKGYRNFGTKLWNACRFAEMNGVWEGHATQGSPPAAAATVNRWILGATARAQGEIDAALAAYRFNDAAAAAYGFVWGTVCDWYVEFAKPLLQGGGAAAAETRAVMAWVLDRCMILLHPMMPFLTEALWGETGARATLLAHAAWDAPIPAADPAAEAEMAWVIAAIEGVRSARAQVNVPVGLHVPVILAEADDAARTAWGNNAALITRLARIGELAEGAIPKGAITIPLPGATLALPLAGLVDVAAEKARVEKALEKLGRDLGGLRGRLGNAGFLASAPPEVVAETRAALALREEEEGQLRAALARLAELA